MSAVDADAAAAPLKTKGKKSRFDRANFCSRWSFSWLNGLVGRARSEVVTLDMLDLPRDEHAAAAFAVFDHKWSQETKEAKPSLLRALRHSFWREFVVAGVWKFLWGAFVLLAAFYFVRALVDFLATRALFADRIWYGWVQSVAFFLSCIILSLSLQQMSSHASRAGIQARAALMTAIYRKAVRLGSEQHVSEVMSLVSSDCSRILEGAQSVHYLWSGPVESLVIVALLIYLTGYAGVVSLGLVALLLPFQLLVAKFMSANRDSSSKATETRVQVMHEILLAIKLVKFYAWETSFAKEVADWRKKELKFLQGASVFKSINLMLVFLIPPLLALGIFAVYVIALGKTLDAAVAFTTLSLFNTLRFPLIMLPRAIRATVEARSSLIKIQAFLLLKEIETKPRAKPCDLVIKDADIAYGSLEDSPIVLKNINFKLKRGELCGMVGPVGAGKSTLLNALLGESRVVSGSMTVGGRFAFVPQNPWVQHGTVRDNILFGLEYEEDRYQNAVAASALLPDFAIFPDGDLMQIGERGINISGGQKQRIAFARALYSDADVFLFDSPLSAVDQLTCTHMFEQGLKKALKGKTIILVTHQLELLKRCDQICIMRENQIAFLGPYKQKVMRKHFPDLDMHSLAADKPSELKQRKERLEASFYAGDLGHEDQILGDDDPQRLTESSSEDMEAKEEFIDVDEMSQAEDNYATYISTVYKSAFTRQDLAVQRKKDVTSPFTVYLKRGGPFLWSIAIFIVFFAQAVRIASDQFIRDWVSNSYGLSATWYLVIYAILVAAFGIFLTLRGVVFYRVALRASTIFHNRLFEKILSAPISFFTTTPMGPLLNSFSKDQDSVDQNLPDSFHMFLIYLAILLTTLIIVCVQIYYYAIACVLLLAIFVLIQYLASPALSALKALIGETSGPVFAHLGETLHGIGVVRSFDAVPRFIAHNTELIDRTHKSLFHTIQMNLWMSFYLDILGALMVFGTALYVVGDTSISPSAGGLAISNTIQLLVFFSLLVRDFNEIQSEVHAVKRIETYTSKTATEYEAPSPAPLPQDWPTAGRIEYSKVVMRYFSFWPRVLNNVSFTIKGGDKIGVCGRTGSGKSSLIMALFRLVQLSHGKILIDDVDIAECALREMRGKLSIIPQEPVMFTGTIRSNLDPFDQLPDDKLWHSLDLSGLKKYVQDLPEGLNAPVAANGDNFSLGQKQLICVARAALNDSRVLVLDEATSAMDLETDKLIQTVIRSAFKNRTIITIAHRLDTIIDSDRILVMDKGKVDEYDTVPNLLRKKDGSFYSLVKESGMNIKAILAQFDARSTDPSAAPSPRKERSSSPKKERQSSKSSKSSKASIINGDKATNGEKEEQPLKLAQKIKTKKRGQEMKKLEQKMTQEKAKD